MPFPHERIACSDGLVCDIFWSSVPWHQDFFQEKIGMGNLLNILGVLERWGHIYILVYIYIYVYTHHTVYIDTNRCISRRGVYWSPSFGGTDLKYFLLPQMTWRSPLTTWKMLGRTWWLRLVGVPNLEVYSLNLGPQWPTHPSLYKDGAFLKQNPLKRTSTKRLVKYSSSESGWLTSIGFLRSRKLLKETCWSRLVMENKVWIYKLYSLIPDLQIDIPFPHHFSLHFFITSFQRLNCKEFCVFLFANGPFAELVLKGINNHNIDIDSARTLLGAAVLATAQAKVKRQASKLPAIYSTTKLIWEWNENPTLAFFAWFP